MVVFVTAKTIVFHRRVITKAAAFNAFFIATEAEMLILFLSILLIYGGGVFHKLFVIGWSGHIIHWINAVLYTTLIKKGCVTSESTKSSIAATGEDVAMAVSRSFVLVVALLARLLVGRGRRAVNHYGLTGLWWAEILCLFFRRRCHCINFSSCSLWNKCWFMLRDNDGARGLLCSIGAFIDRGRKVIIDFIIIVVINK